MSFKKIRVLFFIIALCFPITSFAVDLDSYSLYPPKRTAKQKKNMRLNAIKLTGDYGFATRVGKYSGPFGSGFSEADIHGYGARIYFQHYFSKYPLWSIVMDTGQPPVHHKRFLIGIINPSATDNTFMSITQLWAAAFSIERQLSTFGNCHERNDDNAFGLDCNTISFGIGVLATVQRLKVDMAGVNTITPTSTVKLLGSPFLSFDALVPICTEQNCESTPLAVMFGFRLIWMIGDRLSGTTPAGNEYAFRTFGAFQTEFSAGLAFGL